MVIKIPEEVVSKKMLRLINRCAEEHRWHIDPFFEALTRGATYFNKPSSYNYKRITANVLINHHHKFLLPDLSNYYEATREAIEALLPEQYSQRKAIKAAAILQGTHLVYNKILEESVLYKLRSIKVKRINEPKRPVIYFQDLHRLLNFIRSSKRPVYSKNLDAILILFLFYTGLRISECLNLTLSHVYLDQDRIFVENGKGGKNRWVGIHKDLKPDFLNFITKLRPNSNLDNVFLLENGSAITLDRALKRLKKLTSKLGLPNSFHMFRAGMATYFHCEKNVPLESLQKILGHSDISTTMVYVRSSTEETVRKQVNW